MGEEMNVLGGDNCEPYVVDMAYTLEGGANGSKQRDACFGWSCFLGNMILTFFGGV